MNHVRPALAALFVSLSTVTACAAPQEDAVAEGSSDLISDVAAMTRRADGNFDVTCRGKNGGASWTEVVTEQQVMTNQVCNTPPAPPPPPSQPGDLVMQSRKVEIPAYYAWQFGVKDKEWWTLWSGQMSFSAAHDGCIVITDGTNTRYTVRAAGQRYEQLQSPIVFKNECGTHQSLTLTGLVIRATPRSPTERAPFYATFGQDETEKSLGWVGGDLPGFHATVTAKARFLNNFTNGNSCSRVTIRSSDGRTFELSPSAPSSRVDVLLPYEIVASRTCMSSPAPSREASFDIAVNFDDVALSN